ncbi:LPS export ABC transporter ATP-binding protein [Litorivicinus sp.]|jgi:lipopolysaccharide export system ATP-binding protein|nr:LPS export ABC transporter ATP-binding protein [Litorivicinus sp.]MDB9861874.1 LPS export ABC transporter ATP-binding protein [Litorivicinus sp.]MDC1208085.1 LPS export ABC transporter ATP-binding protein [Litorivicinus sp.]MDC1466163.1 LPS export ABC transporter ATP-binding protein [Litorivicinus sp.]|tara:strand:+ start:2671 stop:3408 length:738 start_codon:yes stop_codon:yes gene_type:complete
MTGLSAQNLRKSYKGREAVANLSLCVNPGEIVGLLGPNGAGKTTSFYMIAGLINQDSGQISIGENDITHMPMHERALAGLGYLPQEASVFRRLTVADNLMAILELRTDLSKNDRQKERERLLDEFNLGHLSGIKGMALSGGERRRVEIARALCSRPKFILLDEPFAGVDPISVSDIQDIICHLATRGLGVLITDHNVRETLRICHRAYIVNSGKVLAEGDPASLLANADVRSIYLGEQFTMTLSE